MLNGIYYFRGLMLGLASLSLLLAACGSDSSGVDGTAGQVGVETVTTAGSSEASRIQQTLQRAIVSERLPYAEVEDELVYGYFAFPSDMNDPLPAIIVIHEWWGLDDHVRAMANRLAAEGYIVLAVDLFNGKTGTTAIEARQLMLDVVENPDPAAENIRQAYDFVSSAAGAPRIASIGWGFGGDWALNTAMLFPDELDAVVIYYGQVTDDEDVLRPINTPILGLFGAEDTSTPIKTVQRFEAALERLRKNYEIHIYPTAGFSFANPTSRSYDDKVAEDAWKRTLEFLAYNLVVEEVES